MGKFRRAKKGDKGDSSVEKAEEKQEYLQISREENASKQTSLKVIEKSRRGH